MHAKTDDKNKCALQYVLWRLQNHMKTHVIFLFISLSNIW